MFELTKSLFKEFAESAIRLARKLSVSRCIKGRHEQEYYGLCEDGYFILPEFLSRDVCKEMISDIDMYIDKETDRINIWSDEVGADRRVYFVESINDRFNRFYEEPYFREVLASYTGITEPKGFVLAARIDAVNGNIGSGGGGIETRQCIIKRKLCAISLMFIKITVLFSISPSRIQKSLLFPHI